MVHPNYRRKGIARKLLKNALDWIRKKKMKKAVLYVISANVPAKNLYTNFGFREFEKIAYLLGNIDSLSQPENIEGIRIRNFQKNDIDAVYELTKSSEDQKHLEILGFNRNDLKSSFFERVFRFFKENKNSCSAWQLHSWVCSSNLHDGY